MSLLSLHDVTKRHPRGTRAPRERVALRAVSLEVEPGEFVAVWGRRRAARTTLLEVAAGLEAPTEGVVQFDGCDLARASRIGMEHGIGFCHPNFSRMHGVVVEQVATPLLKNGTSVTLAQDRAYDLLDRVGVADCAEVAINDLEHWELVRVMIARGLVMRPRLLLLDAPASGLPAPERDTTLQVLRAITREEGTAVLMTVDEVPGLARIVDRLLSISNGELRGDVTPQPATVVPLRRSERPA